jgi:anti-sigma B factor antagonist
MMLATGLGSMGAVMLIQAYDREGVVVVRLQGRLDSQTAAAATAEMAQVLASAPSSVLLNLAELEFISSAGLRILVQVAREMRARQGVIKLCAPIEAVRKLLELSGLTQLLDLYDSEADALSSF